MSEMHFEIRHIGLLISKYASTIRNQYDLTHLDGPQGQVLMFLYQKQGESVYQKDIERKLQIQKATASGLIKRMEKNGFIQVEVLSTDKRFKTITLTPLGQDKVQHMHNFLKDIEQMLCKNLSSQERTQFIKTLKKMKQNVQDATGGKEDDSSIKKTKAE